MDAAIVELDPLPDPIGAAAQHDDFLAVGGRGLALVFVRRVHVRGLRCKFGGARVDALEHRPQVHRMTSCADRGFGRPEEMGEAPVGKTFALELAKVVPMERIERALFDCELEVDDLFDLREKPRVDLRVGVRFFDRHADRHCVGDIP